MKEPTILRDERTIAVENSSYRWGFQILAYGLLVIIAIRGFFFKESNWDLMALVIFSSLVATLYQGLHHIFTRRWVIVFAVTVALSAVVAAFIAFFVR